MTMSFEAPPTVVSDERAGSLARRMLGGSAAASLYAYRDDESLPFVAHGIATDGTLVVAAVPERMLAAVAPGFAVDVRMDLIKQSPDPSISLVAASLHLLGTLTWATPAEASDRVAGGGLPSLVEAALEAPGARLGFIDVERALLHDLDGATVIPHDEMYYAPPVIEDEYATFGALVSHGQTGLKDLCWAVMVGEVPGQVVAKPPLPMMCPHTADTVLCVDVDTTGVTVMFVGRSETLVVNACFGGVATSQADAEARVARLMRDAAPALAG